MSSFWVTDREKQCHEKDPMEINVRLLNCYLYT